MLRAACIAPSKLLVRFGRLPSLPSVVVCQLSVSAITRIPKIKMTAKEDARPLEVSDEQCRNIMESHFSFSIFYVCTVVIIHLWGGGRGATN